MDIDGSERETGDWATEDGIVIGNTYDKYGATNPVARRLMDGFLAKFDDLVSHSEAGNVHEVGCGEGKLSIRLAISGASSCAAPGTGPGGAECGRAPLC